MSEQNSPLERLLILLVLAALLATALQVALYQPLPTSRDAQALAAALQDAESNTSVLRASTNADGSLNVVRAFTSLLCAVTGILFDAPLLFTGIGLLCFLIPFICLTHWQFRFLSSPARRIAFPGILFFVLARTVHPSEGLLHTPALAALTCVLIALLDYDYESKRTRYIARGLALISGLTGILASCFIPALALRYYRTRQRDLGIVTVILTGTFVAQLLFMIRGSQTEFSWFQVPPPYTSTAQLMLEILIGRDFGASLLPHVPGPVLLLISGALLVALLVACVAYALEHQKWPLLGAFSGLLTLLLLLVMHLTTISGGFTACLMTFTVFLCICALDKRVQPAWKAMCQILLTISVFSGSRTFIAEITNPPCIARPAHLWEQQVTEYLQGKASSLPACPAGTSVEFP